MIIFSPFSRDLGDCDKVKEPQTGRVFNWRSRKPRIIFQKPIVFEKNQNRAGWLKVFQRTDRIEWTKKSWDCYKLIISVYETRQNAKEALKDEINHIREMTDLMPKKLDQIAQSSTLV